MVDDADGCMGEALRVGEERHVHGPGVIDGDRERLGRTDLAVQIGDFLLVAGNQIGHKGFAHAHAGMQSVEGVGTARQPARGMWALRRKTSRRSQLGLRRWWDAIGGVQALGRRVKSWFWLLMHRAQCPH